jgi:hypothetical protein
MAIDALAEIKKDDVGQQTLVETLADRISDMEADQKEILARLEEAWEVD